eukprot:TRINITY_DN13415_c0_g1_i1.p1 TRINITY_DN13415_c0_g1~~TRINITY_DN13415_c0_g1_i1.p1  ORF type:complete len:266 (-),score=89.32 TRINITY_DN13415_c0_g1_i1:162-959(-)
MRYYNHGLDLSMQMRPSKNSKFERCFAKSEINMPPVFHVGFSAANDGTNTGDAVKISGLTIKKVQEIKTATPSKLRKGKKGKAKGPIEELKDKVHDMHATHTDAFLESTLVMLKRDHESRHNEFQAIEQLMDKVGKKTGIVQSDGLKTTMADGMTQLMKSVQQLQDEHGRMKQSLSELSAQHRGAGDAGATAAAAQELERLTKDASQIHQRDMKALQRRAKDMREDGHAGSWWTVLLVFQVVVVVGLVGKSVMTKQSGPMKLHDV